MCFETHPIGLILDTMSCWMLFTTSRMFGSCAGQMAKVWRWQGLRCFLPGSTKETIWRMEGWLARTGGALLHGVVIIKATIKMRFLLFWRYIIYIRNLFVLFNGQPVWHVHSRFCYHILLRPHVPHCLRNLRWISSWTQKLSGDTWPLCIATTTVTCWQFSRLNRCEQMDVFLFCLVEVKHVEIDWKDFSQVVGSKSIMEHIILITLCLRTRCPKTHCWSFWQYLHVETSPDPSMKFFKLRRNHQVVKLSKPGRIAAIRGQQQWGVLKTGNHWVQFIPICWDRESEDFWQTSDAFMIYILYMW